MVESFRAARSLFPHTGNISYLNSASYCPLAQPVADVINENLQLRLLASEDDTNLIFETANELRGDFARLVGANKREIGLGQNTSHGLNVAAFGLPLKAGDEVLVSDVEFPAVIYTWQAAAKVRRLALRFVRSRGRCFDPDELKRSITKRSRVLSLSWVQFFNGFKNDLAELGRICRKRGIYFVVDGIQGMGVEPINVRRLGVDIFTSGCQKWMLAPQGTGFFFISDRVRDRLVTPFMSWHEVDWKLNWTDLFQYHLPPFDSARRFEMAYYNVMGLLGLKAAVKIFQTLGVRNIQRHNYRLIDKLADYVHRNPHYTITCNMRPEHRSSIFTFTCRGYQALHRQLLKHKIIASQREGSIRVSVHLFNDDTDIDRVIAVLEKFPACG